MSDVENLSTATSGEPVPSAGEFATHYETINTVLRTLREQRVADIDALVPLVDKALESYKFCKGRIAAVRGLLETKLDSGSSDTGAD